AGPSRVAGTSRGVRGPLQHQRLGTRVASATRPWGVGGRVQASVDPGRRVGPARGVADVDARGRVSVILPWSPGCPRRAGALSWVLDLWEDTGWPAVGGEQPGGGAWCQAAAVAGGLADAPGDGLVVADADVWCDGLGAAVDAVSGGAGWAVPHRLVY